MPNYKIPMSEPDLSDLEADYLRRCVSENWISSAGPFINEFERRIAKYFDRGFAIATSSGTAALELGLRAQGVSVGDRVLIPDWTFAGTINAVIHLGAVPVICDISPSNYGLCLDSAQKCFDESLANGEQIAAIMPVHPLGNPLNLDELYRFANKNKLIVVEDAAGAFNSKLHGKLVGSGGDVVAFSFNGNKVLTCGGGGMVLTDNLSIAEKIKFYRSNSVGVYDYQVVGYNHQMLNTAAGIGLAQLERIEDISVRRSRIHKRYRDEIPTCHGLFSIAQVPEYVQSNSWLFWLLFKDTGLADQFIKFLEDLSIQSRVFWKSLSLSPAYESLVCTDLVHSQSISSRVVTIPSGSKLSFEDQSNVIDAIRDWVKSKK